MIIFPAFCLPPLTQAGGEATTLVTRFCKKITRLHAPPVFLFLAVGETAQGMPTCHRYPLIAFRAPASGAGRGSVQAYHVRRARRGGPQAGHDRRTGRRGRAAARHRPGDTDTTWSVRKNG